MIPSVLGVGGAHPRSRGENSASKARAKGTTGSSPLTRGKLDNAGAALGRHGLIPAHAGKTAAELGFQKVGGAHPRSRGENSKENPAPPKAAGSSPLTRGKRIKDAADTMGKRLIPAHAGKTVVVLGAQGGGAGSSPLTRGKPGRRQVHRRAVGLIPAHAGKTRFIITSVDPGPAHPRSRGENDTSRIENAAGNGSSPLTRGKQRFAVGATGVKGLIPAHAGKTARRWPRSARMWAHPRSRGEN